MTVLELCLGAAALAYLVGTGRLDLRELLRVGEAWPWLLAAQACFGAAQLVAAERWRLLLRGQGLETSFASAFRLTLVGIFFNQVLLGSTGGDMARAWGAARDNPDRRSAAVLSVFVDRGVGLAMLLVVALAAGLLNVGLVRGHRELAWILLGMAGLLTTAIGGLALFFSERTRALPPVRWLWTHAPAKRVLRKLLEALRAYRSRPRDLARSAAWGALLHLLIIATNACLAASLVGGEVDAIAFSLLIPIALAVMALPVNPPGAIGTGEASYAYFLGMAGFSQGSLVSVLQRLTFGLWGVAGVLAGGSLGAARRMAEASEGPRAL